MVEVVDSLDPVETAVNGLLERGKKRGYLTWEEMNESLPDEAVQAVHE